MGLFVLSTNTKMYICTSCIYLILGLAQQSVCFSFAGLYEGIKYLTISRLTERCDNRWVIENVEALSDELDRRVFGQELAVKVVLGALEGHSKNKHKRKPLVLDFHGWTGGGKGYVADIIIRNWFREGDKSSFVKIYHAKNDFPLENETYNYQRRLQDELESTVRKCSKSMFVFDEVDKYPSGLLDGIKPYLDYNSQVRGLDFREAIFVFITNCGDSLITQIVLDKFTKGISRDELVMRDFESHLKMISYNKEGGYFQSDLIKHHLVDHMIPFLPLERKHVRSCIEAEVMLQDGDYNDLETIISQIMPELTFGPVENDLFCVSGCKHISQQVNEIIYEKKKKSRRRTEF